MSLVTRMRSKLQLKLDPLTQPDPKYHDEKTAQSVCLLSIVLLLPYLSRPDVNSLLSTAGLAYSGLVLPMVVTANYCFPIGALRFITCYAVDTLTGLLQPTKGILLRAYSHLDKCERVYMKMTNISVLLSQVAVFSVCDRMLLPDQRVTCLYTLMFYNVIAYCFSYIRELITKEDWSMVVKLTDHSSIRHLAMSTTKIVLEWTKAVTFIITVVFMLLVFGLEQGLHNYTPTGGYLIVTGLYYCTTEKVFTEHFPLLLSLTQIDRLECMEALWAPTILKAATVVIATALALPVLLQDHVRLALLALYVSVWIKLRDLHLHDIPTLRAEYGRIRNFRQATKDELDAHDDVCAVCLWQMRNARVTPCHHMFHGDCLRRCLQASHLCPFCKRDLTFDRLL